MNNAFIYRHITLDTNKVFYIGIGISKKRAKSKSSRNLYWHNIINKHGYSVEILKDNLSWDEAIELEKILISWYGRRNLGTGCLVNMTDGGEGLLNYVVSEELREKRRSNRKGTINSPETRKRISLSKIGSKLSEEVKSKISNTKKGTKHSEETKLKMRGKKPSLESRVKMSESHCKKIIDIETGTIFKSVKEASEYNDINYNNLVAYLIGNVKNKTNLRYYEEVLQP